MGYEERKRMRCCSGACSFTVACPSERVKMTAPNVFSQGIFSFQDMVCKLYTLSCKLL